MGFINPRTLTNFYTWAIKILVLTIPFLSLWIARSLYFPYITGRNFGFRILVEVALALWIGLMVLDKSYRPRRSLLLWVLIIFTAIVGLADLFGVNPYHSFWSSYERMEGYLMIVHLLAYFLILTSVFRTKKDWFILGNIFVIAGVLVGGYGVLQILGIKEAIQGGDVRIDGTIGNPTYLAVYLLLVLALTAILFFNARKRWLKYCYGAVILFSFLIIYFTASRGVALALLIGMPLFLVLYLIFFRGVNGAERVYKKIALAILAALILLPIGFWLVKDARFIEESNVLSRFASISFDETTIRSRFTIWNMSWQGVKDRPLLGWGQENYIHVFSKYFNPRLYDQEPWFDRAHNIVFDWLVNAGLLGFIAYLSIFVAFYLSLKEILKRNVILKKEGLILLVLPIAYFIQNIFVFDNFNTYVLFFAILGYVSFLGREQDDVALGEKRQSAPESRRVSTSLIAGGLALVVIGLIIYAVNVKPWRQAGGIIRSLQATTHTTDPINTTIESFKETLGLNTFGNTETIEQLLRVGDLLVGQDFPAEIKLSFINFAASRAEDYLKKFPNSIRVQLMLGTFYQNASAVEGNFLFKGRDHLQSALELSPKKQQIYLVLAENYLRSQEIPKAFELLDQAIALEPNNPEPYTVKALMGVLIGRDDLVAASINELDQLRLGASPEMAGRALGNYISALDRIAGLYVRAGASQKAKAILLQIIKVAPNPEPYQKILDEL